MRKNETLVKLSKRYTRIDAKSRNSELSALSFTKLDQSQLNNINGYFPWELNVLFTISLFNDNPWKKDAYTEKNFRSDINLLRKDINDLKEKDIGKWITIYLSQQQFPYQNNVFALLFRYDYYFSFVNEKVNMSEYFYSFYNCYYKDFKNYLIIYILLASTKTDFRKIDNNVLLTIDESFKNVVDLISIDKESLSKYYEQLHIDNLEYINYFCPLIQFPYVNTENGCLRAYHNLIEACTNSLLYRLTYNNKSLNELIGKNVLESYLLYITKLNPTIKYVRGEYYYSKGKLTPDLLASDGESILLVESKSFTPKIKLRTCDDVVYENEIEIIVKDIIQLYKHCRDYYGIDYNTFDVSVDEHRENIFGLVVIKNNPYFDNADLYNRVSTKLKINVESADYNWLISHVGVVDIDAYEKFMMSNVRNLAEILNKPKSDYWLIDVFKYEYCEYLNKYRERVLDDNEKIISDMFCKTSEQ